MFKDLLKKWLAEILTKFNQAGDGTELLTKAISGLNRGLYGYVKTVMQSVVMPVAYTILALFFLLELYKASQRVEGIGGGSSLGAEVVFRAMFKMALCKMAVDSSLLFMEAIYAVFQNITSGIETAVTIEAGVDEQ